MEFTQSAFKTFSLFGAVTRFLAVAAICLTAAFTAFSQVSGDAIDSAPVVQSTGKFRIGEKLTYGVSFGGRFNNAAYFEMAVISGGKLSGRDAVELRSKIKTLEMISAAFVQLDESRIVYASPDTGLPIYIVKTDHSGPLPKDTVYDYLAQPTSNFDLLSLIYKVRENGGSGTYTFTEKDQLYTANFVIHEKPELAVRTEAGTFDTKVSLVQSEFFTSLGISQFKINFSADEFHVPVLIRFKTAKGEFRVSLSAINLAEDPVTPPVLIPVQTATPVVGKPVPTPEVYVDNRPLLPELGFQVGESLDYKVTSGGIPAGVITLSAKERKLFQNEDSLLLSATVTRVEPGSQPLRLGDAVRAQVDPDTLIPRFIESRFNSGFMGLNQTATFDSKSGSITIAGEKPVDAPIGTHSIISLIYAMRSFNLRPSKDPSNPVNDTRVAVFWESKPYIFTLRPSNPEDLMLNGEKVSAQLITINTGNPQLDVLSPRVWIATDTRVPLRFAAGAFQADLFTQAPKL